MRGLEMPIIKGKKSKYYFREVGRDTKETVEYIEKYYNELYKVRDGASFEELLDEANNPLFFKKKIIEETCLY